MGWDYLAVDKQDAGETQGTIQVSSVLVADPFASADPMAGPASNPTWKCLARLSAPTGLFIFDDTKKLRLETWTGNRDDWVEVDASRWILLQRCCDSFPDILCQSVHVDEMTMDLDFRFGFVVVRIHDFYFGHLVTSGASAGFL